MSIVPRTTVVRQNLMQYKYYTPYCGGQDCLDMPRTVWTGEQFKCPRCGWESQFDQEFMAQYKEKWDK